MNEEQTIGKEIIKNSDIVLHKLSNLYFRCENAKQSRWMNMNPFYSLQPKNIVGESYFKKQTK